jgi:hypothetical protein
MDSVYFTLPVMDDDDEWNFRKSNVTLDIGDGNGIGIYHELDLNDYPQSGGLCTNVFFVIHYIKYELNQTEISERLARNPDKDLKWIASQIINFVIDQYSFVKRIGQGNVESIKFEIILGDEAFERLTSENIAPSELDVSNTAIGDKSIQAMCLTQELDILHFHKLNLSKNFITDEGVIVLASNLSKFKNLEYLNLADNEFGAEGIQEIVNYLGDDTNENQLVSIDLSGNEIDESTMKILIEEQNKVTYVEGNDNVTILFGKTSVDITIPEGFDKSILKRLVDTKPRLTPSSPSGSGIDVEGVEKGGR